MRLCFCAQRLSINARTIRMPPEGARLPGRATARAAIANCYAYGAFAYSSYMLVVILILMAQAERYCRQRVTRVARYFSRSTCYM